MMPSAAGGDLGHQARNSMVAQQIAGRGVTDPRVLAAMRAVPRHDFVPADQQSSAYHDSALPIWNGQTISQPFMVAYMTQALGLSPQDEVLEVGTGSGYQTAVLAELVKTVYTIEVRADLAERSRALLDSLGYRNIRFHRGNGADGWPGDVLFDGIMVTACCERLPEKLMGQLRPGARLVVPMGNGHQQLVRVTETHGERRSEELMTVRFVPFVWPGDGCS